jgi:hypothetical protein
MNNVMLNSNKKSFILITSIEGNYENPVKVKKYIDVTSIREISECDDYFEFKTTEIIFDNGREAVYMKESINDVIEMLKGAEKLC